VIVALVWMEFRILHGSAAGAEARANPSGRASSTAEVVTPLADGVHEGVLVASPRGRITVNLVALLRKDAAAKKCQQDFGPVPPQAVCRFYYLPRIETGPRTLPVAKDASVGYVVKVNRQGVLYGQLTGVGLAKLTAVSKQYQQGRVFTFQTKNGVFLGGSQEPLGCKEINGITLDGRTEWISKCVATFGLR